jgi:hypothetical protein
MMPREIRVIALLSCSIAFGTILAGCSPTPVNAPASVEPREGRTAGNITLTIDGKSVTYPVKAMNYNHVKRGRDEFPDWFDFEGEGIALTGVFWIGFEEQWDQLVNRPLEIKPHIRSAEEGESKIDLPGQAGVKVAGGTVVVEKVLGQSTEPILRGRLTLHVEARDGGKTLEGTFQAPVETWY